MQILKTKSSKIDKKTAVVEWFVGKDKNGIFKCRLDNEYEDSDIVSELCVIRKLLIEDNVFGRKDVFNNQGLELFVSKGAIKKLILGKSDKTEIQPYAAFLKMLFAGLIPNVTKGEIDVTGEEITLNISRQEYTSTHFRINTPAIGDVYVTYHAVERLKERIIVESGECKNPMQALHKRITNPEIEKVDVPESVLEHKKRKYQASNEVFEVWKHPTSSFNFAIIRNLDTGKKTLVTVFVRK